MSDKRTDRPIEDEIHSWQCTICGSEDEPCLFVNPATEEKPTGCPLKIDTPKWRPL
jgi:hypothetical protein